MSTEQEIKNLQNSMITASFESEYKDLEKIAETLTSAAKKLSTAKEECSMRYNDKGVMDEDFDYLIEKANTLSNMVTQYKEAAQSKITEQINKDNEALSQLRRKLDLENQLNNKPTNRITQPSSVGVVQRYRKR